MPRPLPLVALVVTILTGCNRVAPLADTHRSADALAAAVLDAIARDDRTRLEALALSEAEFRDHVWPDLPAARPERNLPLSYVWGDLHQKSRQGLATALQEHRGRRYELRRVRFEGETRYANYLVHREAAFDVVDSTGTEMALRVCGSFLEKDGVWKVFSYAVSD